jgi:hypothetical protein
VVAFTVVVGFGVVEVVEVEVVVGFEVVGVTLGVQSFSFTHFRVFKSLTYPYLH